MQLFSLILFVTTSYYIYAQGESRNTIKILESQATHAMRYLTQFGYSNVSSKNDNAIPRASFSSSELQKAIVSFQRFFQLPLTGRLDGATQRLMASSRCGNKDSPNVDNTLRDQQSSSKGTRKWSKRVLSYKIISYPSSGLTKTKVDSIFREAFNLWSKVTYLKFYDVYESNADIVISFGKRNHGDPYPFDGRGNVLAHAFYPGKYGQQNQFSIEGDAHFDDDELWTDVNDKKGRILLLTATHEIGHSLGLDHSNVRTAIMFPYYREPTSEIVTLDSDDIKRIKMKYGAPTTPAAPEGTTPAMCSPNTYPDVCSTNIDTLAMLRNRELFIFKDEWCWRVHRSEKINGRYSYRIIDAPYKYKTFWTVLSRIGITTGIDVMFESSRSQLLIYVFRNKRFWVLKDNKNLANGFSSRGQPLSRLGLPASLDKVDAMFVWGWNVYIFAGHLYWRFNVEKGSHGRVISSPRFISRMWRGLTTPINAAYTETGSKTYFFRGKQYHLYFTYKMNEATAFTSPFGCSASKELEL